MKFILSLLVLCILGLTRGKSCKILSLSGGGAHGAFQAGVIAKLHNQGHRWDVVTGISAGSINGMILGMFDQSEQPKAVSVMKEVWFNLTSADVYNWNKLPFIDQSLLDSTPLNETIYEYSVRYGGKAKREIIIGSVNLNNGLLRLFYSKEFSSPYRSSQIIMASSAIPVVFPPIFLDNGYYVDGGTFSNELIRPAIKMCLTSGFVKTDIEIHTIMCSSPIDKVDNKYISSSKIFGLMSRAYDILSNAMFNHEIYTNCGDNQEEYPLFIYKPLSPYPGGLLDFNHKDLIKMFEQGYNLQNYTSGKYCY